MQCVAAVAQWCSAVEVNGCVARRHETQLVVWLAVNGGGNGRGWGGGGEMKPRQQIKKAARCEL